MTTTPSGQRHAPEDETAVLAYLRAHPDVLARNPDVLTQLELPHEPGGRAVSLIERQVALLRQRNAELEQRLAELMRAARDNERVGRCLLDLGRRLLEADSIDASLATVREALLDDSGADAVVVRLLDVGSDATRAQPERYMATEGSDAAAFADLLATGEPVCGAASEHQLAALFGADAARVGSVALVPLRAGQPLGVLAIASDDPNHYRSDMGTLFLRQLGQLVAAGLARYLQPT
jgi:uncharacterized protein YigA (DUF484 family)